MKQIKILLLVLCLGSFGAINAQVEATIQYVATYTWTGGTNTQWANAGNWTVTHNAPPPPDGPDVPAFPGITNVGGLTQIHHVVIPTGLTNYPNLNGAGGLDQIVTISDLHLDAGASITLSGRTFVVNGFISGTGELLGGPTSSLSFNSLPNLGVYTDMTAHDASFNGPFYFTNFNALNGDLNAGNNGPSPLVPLDFADQNLFSFAALANPGGLFAFDRTGLIQGDLHTIQLSTKAELDDLEIIFNGAPVYTVSGYFSITDADYTPMFLGKQVEFNAGVLTPTTTNDADIVIALANGNTYNYSANASGEYVGFTSSIPIASITIGTGVFIENFQNVGFPTIDDLKFGTRVPTGDVYFRQTGTAKQIRNLTINGADATSLVGGVTLVSPIEVTNIVFPLSGTLNATPSTTPTVSNLTLVSNATVTASIAPHTTAAAVNGNVTVQRYFSSTDLIDLTTPRNKQWRFIGFPYSTPTVINNISGLTYSLTTPTMMKWVDAFGDGNFGSGGNKNAGYFSIQDGLDAIDPGAGMVAWLYDLTGASPTSGTLGAPQTMVTSGPLNESGAPFLKSLSYFNITGPANSGWHLLSNPYASSIDWTSTAIVKSFIDGVVYRWDPQAANWTTFNGTTGTGNFDQYIESGSSFFVKATQNGASISFGQDAKVIAVSSNLNQFGKNGSKLDLAQQKVGNTQKASLSGLRLKASGPGNPIPSEAYLGLSLNDATEGFDSKYDAYNKGRASGANVAILGQDKNTYAMQFDRPILENGKEKRYYPLTVTVPEAGKTKLELNVEGTWNSLNKVYLIDKKNGKTIPLSGNKMSYEFTMATTEESDRFMLAINHINVGEKSGITATDVRVMNNPVRSDVIDAIIAHPSAKAKSYSIVNGSGATLNSGSIQDNNSVQHQLGFGKSNANGVMYLRVNFENGDSKTVKFIKL